MQREDDSRVYAASKSIFSFDQVREVHEATTDKLGVLWVGWNAAQSQIITVSERNVITWDALMGSKITINSNVCADEISAACLDDRRRKIVLGNIKGQTGEAQKNTCVCSLFIVAHLFV